MFTEALWREQLCVNTSLFCPLFPHFFLVLYTKQRVVCFFRVLKDSLLSLQESTNRDRVVWVFQAKCRPWLVKAAGGAPASAPVTGKLTPLIATKLRIVIVYCRETSYLGLFPLPGSRSEQDHIHTFSSRGLSHESQVVPRNTSSYDIFIFSFSMGVQ